MKAIFQETFISEGITASSSTIGSLGITDSGTPQPLDSSAVMEGPLSKWTNVVHGWQFRWFVLNDDVLCYFTSRDKMLKKQQRGCIRLRGAAIGIDGENNTLFTITVDGKVFHLQVGFLMFIAFQRLPVLYANFYNGNPEDFKDLRGCFRDIFEIDARSQLLRKNNRVALFILMIKL